MGYGVRRGAALAVEIVLTPFSLHMATSIMPGQPDNWPIWDVPTYAHPLEIPYLTHVKPTILRSISVRQNSSHGLRDFSRRAPLILVSAGFHSRNTFHLALIGK
jgi:hypothetical protein